MIEKFQMEYKDGSCYLGYDNQLVNAGRFIIENGQDPCIAIKIKPNGKIVYVDYYNGESIIPEYIEAS